MIEFDWKAERKANDNVIKQIQPYKEVLTKQQYKTLIGQAKSGSREAALKGLNKLLKRLEKSNVA